MKNNVFSQFGLLSEVREKFIFDKFIIAGGNDYRAYQSLKILQKEGHTVNEVLVFDFKERRALGNPNYLEFERFGFNIKKVVCSIHEPSSCIKNNIKKDIFDTENSHGIDISCFTKPYFFSILKYLKCNIKIKEIVNVYTEPLSYKFLGSALDTYHSTRGPLSVEELPGYQGRSVRDSRNVLIVLLGFDGELSSFITEEISPDVIYVVNGFPGYFPKFKDISLINNEKLIGSSTIYYAKASNPFDVYNLLESIKRNLNDSNIYINIAPLGTKPMALGACFFALHNNSVRVVYPKPEQYESVTNEDCWNTWFYNIPLSVDWEKI